jgi:hypothetical protein
LHPDSDFWENDLDCDFVSFVSHRYCVSSDCFSIPTMESQPPLAAQLLLPH